MIEKKIDNYKLFIFKNKIELSDYFSKYIQEEIKHTLKNKERYQFSVCGGSTPKLIYQRISTLNLPWHKVDIFLGDERYVDTNSSESNTLMIKNCLLQNHASKAYFYEIFKDKEFNNELSKKLFTKKLMEKCPGDPPKFDLTLLGLGDDGHTASLFPYMEFDDNELVINSFGKGLKRISLTPKIISSSSKIVFIVTGSSKNLALKRLIDKNESSQRTPAKLINSKSEIFIFTDPEASDQL
tara:strand:+ start:254 stop:973 length:720 start_codon:yes stop_codon:yes gene_type:complete